MFLETAPNLCASWREANDFFPPYFSYFWVGRYIKTLNDWPRRKQRALFLLDPNGWVFRRVKKLIVSLGVSHSVLSEPRNLYCYLFVGLVLSMRSIQHFFLCSLLYNFRFFYHRAYVCSWFNANSSWLILRHYSSVMPTGRLQACKNKANSSIMKKSFSINSERSVFREKSETSSSPYWPHSRELILSNDDNDAEDEVIFYNWGKFAIVQICSVHQ